MKTAEQQRRDAAVQMIATAWSNLAAWRPVDMRNLRVVIKRRSGWSSSGCCTTSRAHGAVDVVVRLGSDEADGLAVLLHELTHAAVQRRGGDGHDALFRATLRAAALEVLGVAVPDAPATRGSRAVRRSLTCLVADAFRERWQLRLGDGRREDRADDAEADAEESESEMMRRCA